MLQNDSPRLVKTSSNWDIHIESSDGKSSSSKPIDIHASRKNNHKQMTSSVDDNTVSNWCARAYSYSADGFNTNNMVYGRDNIKTKGRETGLMNNSKNMKVDMENNFQEVFDEKGILHEAITSNTNPNNRVKENPGFINDKKVYVGQLFSNIKWKFGSTSSSKRAKKSADKKITDISYSSRLLFNDGGEWLDRWFSYRSGVLTGYRDEESSKPAEIEIDLHDCTISSINSKNTLKKLNIFQLETKVGSVFLFMAWNTDQYESWIESLSTFMMEFKDTSFDFQLKTIDGEDVTEGGIIPYNQSTNEEEGKTNSSSSETSVNAHAHARVDSIDSGNDGDESGLESSLRSNKNLLEYRKKAEKKTRGVRSSPFNESLENNDKQLVETPDQSIPNYNLKKLELARQLSRESTSTENDLRSPTLLDSQRLDFAGIETFSKNKRSSFMKKKFHFFDKKKRTEQLEVDQSSSPPLFKEEVLDIGPLTPSSAESPPLLKRPSSLDISSLSVSTWDGFEAHNQYKKTSVCSEDDISDMYNIDDKSQEDIEESLRKETLLRKRRNSLTLERSQIVSKLQIFRNKGNQFDDGKSRKKSKLIIQMEKTQEKQEIIIVLEQKLDCINREIENIDKRLFFRKTDMMQREYDKINPKQTKENMNSFSKEEPQGKLAEVNSMSVDNLTNIPTKDQRETETNSNGMRIPSEVKKTKLFVTLSDSGESSGGQSHCGGIEELMITAQKLENKCCATTPLEPKSSPGMWRSKSLGAMEILNPKPKKDFNENNADLIIEDFEKFSEMLSNQIKLQQVHDQKHVEI